MINFFKNINYNLEKESNFKIIETNNIDILLKDLIKFEIQYTEKSILLENAQEISIDDCLIINHFTKISDIIISASKNWLADNVTNNENWNTNLIINNEILKKILEEINLKLGFDFISLEIDNTKFAKSIFKINEAIFIEKNNYLKIFNFLSLINYKKLIIVKDIEYIEIEEIIKFSNLNFLILTNDFTKYIKKYNQLNFVAFYRNKIFVDIQTNVPIINYFENLKNREISEEEDFFNNHDEENQFKYAFFNIKNSFFE
ncbi:hypothetical protein [Metamycoplasma alkalescens]|uniref:hypothetical protein n=1 Tax=Metamycoplasma alkalescens TaxID=45363 RepID=UPI003D047E7A